MYINIPLLGRYYHARYISTAFGVQLALDVSPEFGLVQNDMRNGFNEVKRESMLAAVKQQPGLRGTTVFMQKLLEPKGYMAMGNGTGIVAAPFRCEEGGHQGAVETSFMFSLTVDTAFKAYARRLAEVGGGISAIIDDSYAFGPPRELFAANNQFAIDIAKVGLESQPSKSKCYIDEAHRDEEWNTLRGNIPEGILKNDDGTPITGDNGETLYGLDVCNVPVGMQQYIVKTLKKKLDKIVKSNNKIAELMDPAKWNHPDIPARQMLWLLVSGCLQFKPDYWLRHIRPDWTAEFASGVDESIHELVQMCMGINTNTSWSDIAKERARLPVRLRGLGLRGAMDRRYSQYIGGAAQSLIPLLNRQDKHNNTIVGRMHIPCIVNMLGDGSFDFPLTSPWENMLNNSRPTHNR